MNKDFTVGHATPIKECLCGCKKIVDLLISGINCKGCQKCLENEKFFEEAKKAYELNNEI